MLLDRVACLESALKGNSMQQTSTPVPTVPETIDLRESTPIAIPAPDPELEIADAAVVLEFLAWGRRKDNNFHDSPENESGPRRPHQTQDEGSGPAILVKSALTAQLDVLEILLPSEKHVRQLVDYHAHCLLWYHGSFMASTLKQEINDFYREYNGSIRNKDVNLQWVALLFAVLTGSITCSTQHTANSWGFRELERARLSKQWYQATTTCLNLSNYTESHTIYSIQAISTLTISAHILGLSNTQSVLLAGANRIAQSLGLHRLAQESDTGALHSEMGLRRKRKRETGRRVWCQLCTQDWFSIPFSESYSLNSAFFDTDKPLSCNDNDMMPVPRHTPTIASYCNYLYDIAALIPQLQDAMANSNTLFTKYEQVVSFDEKMRELATSYMPTFLSTNAPVASSWPIYVPWARRSLAICAAHKIIMIHRKFLGMSFTNSAFAFTRRTCLAASRTILKEAQAATDKNGPVLWIDQAFSVAAGIILCLDAFHRKSDEPEFHEHRGLAKEAIAYLSRFTYSTIASRGTQLLTFLVAELSLNETENGRPQRKRRMHELHDSSPGRKKTKTFNLSSFIQSISAEPLTKEAEDPSESATQMAWDAFEDLFPPQTGFGGENLFNELFSFE